MCEIPSSTHDFSVFWPVSLREKSLFPPKDVVRQRKLPYYFITFEHCNQKFRGVYSKIVKIKHCLGV